MKITTIEQNPGLWSIYQGDECLGYVYDDEATASGEQPYHFFALHWWGNAPVIPEQIMGEAANFKDAVALVRAVARLHN